MLFIWTYFLIYLSKSYGDVYMHNPRGSNDRNCERNANRDNGNRLFDSQVSYSLLLLYFLLLSFSDLL